MESFLSLLRLALDRGWTSGTLLALFFGGILVGTAYGLVVPAELQAWSAAGLAFGIAVLFVSLASHAARGADNWIKEWRFRRNLRRMLLDLTQAEREFLRPFIRDGKNTVMHQFPIELPTAYKGRISSIVPQILAYRVRRGCFSHGICNRIPEKS